MNQNMNLQMETSESRTGNRKTGNLQEYINSIYWMQCIIPLQNCNRRGCIDIGVHTGFGSPTGYTGTFGRNGAPGQLRRPCTGGVRGALGLALGFKFTNADAQAIERSNGTVGTTFDSIRG